MMISDDDLQVWAAELAMSCHELAVILEAIRRGDIEDRAQAEQYVWRLRIEGERP